MTCIQAMTHALADCLTRVANPVNTLNAVQTAARDIARTCTEKEQEYATAERIGVTIIVEHVIDAHVDSWIGG